jgi:hypothetical protein
MTKSEAKAIVEATGRTLRALEGIEMPWSDMTEEVRQVVHRNLKSAADEVNRVHAMAHAELDR